MERRMQLISYRKKIFKSQFWITQGLKCISTSLNISFDAINFCTVLSFQNMLLEKETERVNLLTEELEIWNVLFTTP
jgi:hypothetical protein